MSEGYRLGVVRNFAGLLVFLTSAFIFSSAFAGDTSYYYCRTSQGPRFTDFSLSITGNAVTLQPYTSPESAGTRIYHGNVTRVDGDGNYVVDFNSYSQVQFLSAYPNMILTASLFGKLSTGNVRILTSNPANDTIMVCEIKKIFY